MSELLSWLKATIEGDKAAAKKATPPPPFVLSEDADHLMRQNPRDTITRCEAELALLDDYAEAKAFYDKHLSAPAGELHGLNSAIKRLASGYRHRPGFDPEWVSD
jgi:hypothetical protein